MINILGYLLLDLSNFITLRFLVHVLILEKIQNIFRSFDDITVIIT